MASKTTGTKKNAKQSTAKKRQPAKKTSTKSAKSAKTTRKNTTSKAAPQEESFLATEILIWVTLAVGILLTISNFGLAGAFGRKIAALQQGMMGWMAYVFPLLLFCGVAFVVSNKGNRIAYIKTVAGIVLLVQCCVLFELIDEKGGSVGKAIAVRLVPAIGKVGTYVVVIILMVICVVLITEKSILKGMKIGGEKAYDRAREDMQKRKEEAEERRARREAMRVDYQVSGVSFNSTVGRKEDEAGKAEETAGKEAKESTEKKATRRSRKDMSSVLAGAEEAAAKHIMEQTGKIALDDVVINRAMPLSATELIPDPEPVPLEPVKEKLPKFLKGAMQETEKEPESGKDMQTDVAEENVSAVQTEDGVKRQTSGNSKVKADIPKEVAAVADTIAKSEKPVREYRFPPLSLLKHGSKTSGDSDAHLRETAAKLQKTLQTFGVNVTITNISCGPSVTRYELQPEMGVKVSKIVGLADDIKLNLAAADIRIEAPIPGKAAVGIESSGIR